MPALLPAGAERPRAPSLANGTLTVKHEPRPGLVADLDHMPKLIGQPLDDGEAEAKPAGIFLNAAGTAEEVLPDQAEFIGGDAASRIVYLDPEPIALPPAPDHDAALDRVAERIGNQILQNSVEQGRIGADTGRTRMQDETQALPLRHRVEFGGEADQRCVDVMVLQRRLDPAEST